MSDLERSPEDQRRWHALVAEAAKLAADDIRHRDRADDRQLLADLEDIHTRLAAESTDGEAAEPVLRWIEEDSEIDALLADIDEREAE